MNIAIYARKSKVSDSGDSIQVQIDCCKNALFSDPQLSQQNLNFTEYKDEGYSGGNTDRPHFQNLLRDVKSGKIDILISYKLDRIARCLLDFEHTLQILQRYNVKLICVHDKFDTDSLMGEFFLKFTMIFAEMERSNIKARVNDAMYSLAAQGFWSGGEPPLGYQSRKTSTTKNSSDLERKVSYLIIDEEYSHYIPLIFNKYLELGSLSKLSSYLQIHHIKSRKNSNFTPSTLEKILSNPTYCAATEEAFNYFKSLDCKLQNHISDCCDSLSFLPFNRTKKTVDKVGAVDQRNSTITRTIENPPNEWIVSISTHPPLIDASIWLQVQAQLKKNSAKAFDSKMGSTSSVALLTGLLYCKNCGSHMYPMGQSKLKDGTVSYSYRCQTKIKTKGILCNATNVLGHYLDSAVLNEVIDKITTTQHYIPALHHQLERIQHYNTPQVNELLALEKNIQTINTAINNLMNTLDSTSPTSATHTRLLARIETKLEELAKYEQLICTLKEEMAQNNISSTNLEHLIYQLTHYNETISQASRHEKVQLLKSIVKRIEWNGPNKPIDIIFIDLISTSEFPYIPEECEK